MKLPAFGGWGHVGMRFKLTIVCGLLVAASIGIAASRSLQAADDGDKTPVVISGYITKIDLKKKELLVHGTEANPAAGSQKFQGPGGGHGGGGRGGSSGGRGGGGGNGHGSHSPDEAARDFTINVTPDTLIETEKSALTLTDLALQDYVVVLGNPKGRNFNATSITVSNR